MAYKDFHQLGIWSKGYDLLMEIYNTTETFPDFEKYSLKSQITRSANSVIANIAESHGRFSYKDKVRVLYISRGEIVETRSHLAVAYGRKYICKKDFIKINEGYEKLAIDINKYIASIKNK